MASNLEQAEKLIPAEVRMISGCRDEQTSADVSDVNSFQLPDPAGECVSLLASLLAVLRILLVPSLDPCTCTSHTLIVLLFSARIGRAGGACTSALLKVSFSSGKTSRLTSSASSFC